MILKNIKKHLWLWILLTSIFAAEADEYIGVGENFSAGATYTRGDGGGLGQYGYPNDPMIDRAKGYLLKGKVKNAITNYGNFINWYFHPAGMWGDYTYLPDVGMIAGIRGHRYSSEFVWEEADMASICSANQSSWCTQFENSLDVWCSEELYDSWNLDTEILFEINDKDIVTNEDSVITVIAARPNGRYVGIAFETEDDRGIVGSRKKDTYDGVPAILNIDGRNQWVFDFAQSGSEPGGSGNSRVCIAVRDEGLNSDSIDPNKSDAMIGVMYPWGLRPSLKRRAEEFDLYEYGQDGEDWTQDDEYSYYGSTVQESWFTRWNPSSNSDWHASTYSRDYVFGDLVAGDVFADTYFSDSQDDYSLLAHSSIPSTWPSKLTDEGEIVQYWPGWYSQSFNADLPPPCDGDRKNDACWEIVPGRFTSDNDIYMEFDDRWAHRGNMVDSNNEYKQTGYPLGLKVKSTAHSYGVSFAEDIMFVTVWVHNESDEMIMPDGTKLNQSQGFNYEDLSLGFYMDADVLTKDIFNNYAPHTNDDDFMEYIDCKTSRDYYPITAEAPNGCPIRNGEELRVSIAVIGDWDGESNAPRGYSMDPAQETKGTDFGLVAVQMLDSPIATNEIDLDNDGSVDIYPGEKLKMTDWHWFSWYNRPGVVYQEGTAGCCAGDVGKEQARNKEEIQYKVMSGDTTNLSDDEKAWFFHANPLLDDQDPMFNPHFDSVEDLKETSFFIEEPDGLDCVMKMTSGPFDLAVQDSVPFSFCIIYGQDIDDLLNNAEFAQVMYNAKYQGFTPPSTPVVESEVGDRFVKVYWDQSADISSDVVTGYHDFEGYKIYKSIDGGLNWGEESGKIFDNNNIQVGWEPIKQFDLSLEEDLNHCVKQPRIGNCDDDPLPNNSGAEIYDTYRGMAVNGYDPLAPWFFLGSDTGLPSEYDNDPDSGEECSDLDNDPSTPPECRYYWIDRDVMNAVEYTYTVTSYDTGIPVSNQAYGSEQFNANPDEWANPDGYQNIESPRGTTTLDDNLITVIPGPPSTGDDCESVVVVPNPYLSRSGLNETEYKRKISFQNLPDEYTLTIYTVSGELVWSQTDSHPEAQPGMTFWDLRTINNQEPSPGLYLFTLETNEDQSECKHIGKFAIVR